ncbi:hypothetical protein MMC34_004833 [Xylographa carneopallida]|nr:hypothetical protein [Xylographa carneopallida]
MRSYAIILIVFGLTAAVTAHLYSDELHARGLDEYESLFERDLDSFEAAPQLLARDIDEHHLQLQAREAETYYAGYAAGLQARDVDGADLSLHEQLAKRAPPAKPFKMKYHGKCRNGHSEEWVTDQNGLGEQGGSRWVHCPVVVNGKKCGERITWENGYQKVFL